MDKLTPVSVAQHMQTIIRRLAEEGKKSEGLIIAKAETMRDYRLARAKAEVELKTKGLAVTLIKHRAEGDVAQEEADMTIAAEALKAHWFYMENLRAQLNGYQSINRFLADISQ